MVIFDNTNQPKEVHHDPSELHSTAIPLADFIEYQAGSVVSKEMLRKDTGTVTLFAFAQGQGLSEHTAPFDALVASSTGRQKSPLPAVR